MAAQDTQSEANEGAYPPLSQNEIVRFALNNLWLEEQEMPDMNAVWIVLHYGAKAPS